MFWILIGYAQLADTFTTEKTRRYRAVRNAFKAAIVTFRNLDVTNKIVFAGLGSIFDAQSTGHVGKGLLG